MFDIAGIENIDIDSVSDVDGKSEWVKSLAHDYSPPLTWTKIKVMSGPRAANIRFSADSSENLRRDIYYIINDNMLNLLLDCFMFN